MFQIVQPELKVAATPVLLERGCVNVIGLDPIRKQAGPRWHKVRDNVFVRLEGILRQYLGPSDFFSALNDTAVLVTMPATDPEDAQVICLRIAHDLYSNYLGKCDFGTLELFSAMPGHKDSLQLRAIGARQIQRLVARAGLGETPAYNPNSVHPGSAHTAIQIPMRYAPFWDARKEAVTGYVCVAGKRKPISPLLEEASTFDAVARLRMKGELDMLYQSVATLSEHIDSGERFLMVFRVAFETLGSPVGRMEFGAACRSLPADLRPYIIFIIGDMPEGVPQGRLAELVMTLKPFCKAVMADVVPGQRNHSPYHGIGLAAIGIDFAYHQLRGRIGEIEIAKLASEARRLNLGTYISGLGEKALLPAVRDGGVHYVTGPVVAALRDELGPMHRMYWKDVIAGAYAEAFCE